MRIQTYILSAITTCFYLLPAATFARDNKGQQLLQNSPLSFIENKGQVTDQYRHNRTDIQFKVPAQGMNVFIGNGALHYQWLQTDAKPAPSLSATLQKQNETISTYRLDVTLEGANPNATLVTGTALPDREYFKLNGSKMVVAHSYDKVIYKNIYPNIDWVLYTSGGHMEYDFIVHPGGRVSDIRIKYDGATALAATEGNITALTPMGTITEQAPYSYEQETGKNIASDFSVQGNTVLFSADSHSGTLVIDPVLSWATYYGGTGGNDRVNDVTCDAAGNVYIAGQTISANNIATTGSHQNTYSGPAGYFDAFVAAFSKGGQRLWGSYFGDTASDYGLKVACDAFHNVYLTGSTYSANNIATPGAYQTVLSNSASFPDAFLAKFNALDGTLIWSTYFGGSNEEDGYGVICDAVGNIYISGNTYSTDGIASSQQVYHHANLGRYDAYLAKFDSMGHRKWSTYFGGNDFDYCSAIAIDRYGGLYISGKTSSDNYIASADAFQTQLNGSNDAYLAKFDTSGVLQWATYYGSGTDGNAIACDSAANVYLGGETTSQSGIATSGSFQPVFTVGGFNEAYVVKFNSLGRRLWATYYGGSANDYLNDLACDPAGNLYMAGSTSSTNNIATANALRSINSGENAFFAKFKPDGTRSYGTYFGGSAGYEVGNAIAADLNGTVYLVGSTGSDSGIVTSGAFETVFPALYCGYLAAFTGDTNVYIRQPFTDTQFCTLGATLNLKYGTMNHFHLTNIFTVQLSDSLGSFTNTVSVAGVLDSTSGVIACTLPANARGNHYRVRIIASSPVDTSADNGYDIVISPTPVMPDTAFSNSPICTNDTLHLHVVDTASGISFRWTRPGGSFVSGRDLALTGLYLADTGNYYVSAVLNGCVSVPDTVHVSLNLSPLKPLVVANDTLCQNTTLSALAHSGTSGVAYSWTGPGGFSATDSAINIPSIQLAQSGRYIVTADLNGCTSIPDTVNVVVHQQVVPSATIYINPPGPILPGEMIALSTAITNGGTNPTIQWYKNNVALPGGTTSPFYERYFVNGDIIKLVVYSSDPCAVPDSVVVFSDPLSVGAPASTNDGFTLYPNPNKGDFYVRGDIKANEAVLDVQNLLGQSVLLQKVTGKSTIDEQIKLDSKLASGIYLLHIKTETYDKVLKFTLQRQ